MKIEQLDTEQHFQRLSRWIQLESAAEAQRFSERRKRISAELAEKNGESLLDLAIADETSGLAGRQLITFVKRDRTQSLPWTRLKVGSPVVVTATDDENRPSIQGVVSRRRHDSIQIALPDRLDGWNFRIDLSSDETARRRQQAALHAVKSARGRLGVLRKIVLGERDPNFQPEEPCTILGDLNEPQRAAVNFALAASDIAVIHGPPGTGKTTTLVELIRQLVLREHTVLACAPSNTATDHLLSKLVDAKIHVVRLGHPARVTERLRDYSLDLQVEHHDNMKIAREMLREAEQLQRQASRFTRAKPKRGAKIEMRQAANELRRHARLLEKQAVDHVLDQADVVCATTSVDSDFLGDRQYDVVVIDEECQNTEPASWVPLCHANKIVLAGDHCQLPPTVLSRQAIDEGYSISMMEQVVARHGDAVTRLLTRQYRMHAQIMQFSSDAFYQGQLEADATVAHRRLFDLAGVAENDWTRTPVTFIDTAGSGWEEELEPDGESRRNVHEAALVVRKLKQLQQSGLPSAEIAVIAPYAAQVRWLRQLVSDRDLEIDTVDGFQGREKQAVVISLVRSNTHQEIGFLADTRRMNVALTRAKSKLIVIGDSATVGCHSFFRELIEYFESMEAYQTVWEEPGGIDGFD